MKGIVIATSFIFLSACSSFQNQTVSTDIQLPQQDCIGSTELPAFLKDQFAPIDDEMLLQATLGMPEKGMLCQGQVYQSNTDSKVILYRAWNSTNPKSQFGSWWAFYEPSGLIAKYREDYEICYQWSPLDKMVSCTLKAGTKVVVGNGQSAECSQYLTYPVSAAQQVYLEQASDAVFNCQYFDGVMNWQAVQ